MPSLQIDLNDDGAIYVRGFESDEVKAWCRKHNKTVGIGVLNGTMIYPGSELGLDPVIVESDEQKATREHHARLWSEGG